MPTPPNNRDARDARAAARSQRQDNHLQQPHIGLGRADRIRSRSPSPSAPGNFLFPPTALSPKRSATEVQEEQFRDALAFQTTNSMAHLSVDDIVRIATASAQAAARELAIRDPPAADAAATAAASHYKLNKARRIKTR